MCCHQNLSGGPTACIAAPEVVANIRSQIEESLALTGADFRLANAMGLLSADVERPVGFNDGVFYPPTMHEEVPQLSSSEERQLGSPSKMLARRDLAGHNQLNALVLLVDFDDNEGTTSPDHYRSLLFDENNSGSMRKFYQELSAGKLDVVGEVTEWIRAPHPYSYYTAGSSGTGMNFPNNSQGLLLDILKEFTSNDSLSRFDLNGDGFIDGLFIIHAGSGAEGEPNPSLRANMIWSHKWNLRTPFEHNGVKAYAYFTAPEDGRLGVFAHEFGHFLGLPDLYDTSYRSAGVGQWCLMGGGSWNGDGHQPARMSAWCLDQLGWIEPQEISAPWQGSIDTLENDTSACIKLRASGDNLNYFLLENRQREGRDAMLPGSGLAIWRIDETQPDNSRAPWYMVGLLQADGHQDLEFENNSGDDGDLFPGRHNVTSIDDNTHPSLRPTRNSPSNHGVYEIQEVDGIISARIEVTPS